MKPLLLAGGMTVVYLALATLLLRWRTPARPAAFLLRLFLLTVPFFVAAYLAAPALPFDSAPDVPFEDAAFGLFVYAALFFGGGLQLYNIADRGFSLRLLIDVAESSAGALSVDELLDAYGGGQGIDWMIGKRLDGVLQQRLVTLDAGVLRATERGRRSGRLFAAARALFRLDELQAAG